jgi:hypothetical protein
MLLWLFLPNIKKIEKTPTNWQPRELNLAKSTCVGIDQIKNSY